MNLGHSLITFEFAMSLLYLSGICIAMHFALSVALRIALAKDRLLMEKLFAFPPMGQFLTTKPIHLNGKYFWPLTPAPPELARASTLARLLFFASRLTGAAAPLLALGFLSAMVYTAFGPNGALSIAIVGNQTGQ